MREKLRKQFINNLNLRGQISGKIWKSLHLLDEFNKAESNDSLMIYLDFQNEIETTRFVKLPVVIPFCDSDEIIPFRLFSFDDLETGSFGILEPKSELRKDSKRLLSPESLEVVIVPGLAFDTFGNRLGHGKGFYDRFISRLKTTSIKIALCYEFQIVDSIPVTKFDKPVNIIVTENRIIYC